MPRSLDFEYLLTPAGLERHRRVHIDASGRIESIAAASGERFDARIAIPGMPNAHSHAFQRAMAGQGEARIGKDSFWSWREHMYALAAVLDENDLYAIARRAYSDMLRAGFTCVGEFHYLHHRADGSRGEQMGRAVIAAARDVGIRMLFLPVYYRLGGFGEAARPGQRRFTHESPHAFCELLEKFSDVACGIAPHSLRAAPAEELAQLVRLTESVLGGEFPIHMHISEQRAEVEQCVAHHGARPMEVLARSIDLDARWNLVHATHTNASERSTIVASGARVVICPLTEAYLGDGLFVASEFAHTGGQLAIGSDSNVRIDAIEELRMLEYGQRLRSQQRACFASESGLGESLWRTASSSGADALALDVGAIEPGLFADFVTLDTASSPLSGVAPAQLMDAWITAGSRECIDAVYVGGERLVTTGSANSEAEIASDYCKVMSSVAERIRAAGH